MRMNRICAAILFLTGMCFAQNGREMVGSSGRTWSGSGSPQVVTDPGSVAVGTTNGVYNAAMVAGSDIGAKANAAYASASALYTLPTIYIPAGRYTYSTTMSFGGPVTLRCEPGTILNYTGTGKAVKMGPDGLTVSTYSPLPYTVDGCQFTGGGSAAYGIYFNEFLTQTFVRNTIFFNFGNSSAWNIWYQGQNWDDRVDHVYMWNTGQAFNGIYTNAADPANGANGDFGQSNLHVTNSHIQQGGAGAGQGVYLNGLAARIENTDISMYSGASIQLGGWANFPQLTNVYMERDNGSAPAILYGDKSGPRVSAVLTKISLKNVYANLHNLGFGTTAHFMGPATATSAIAKATLDTVVVTEGNSSYELVQENAGHGGTGNTIANSSFAGRVNTAGTPSWGTPLISTNSYGCLDGYDHLPCTVYDSAVIGESAQTGAYATIYTTTAAGWYRVSGTLYATTASSTAYTLEQIVNAAQVGFAGTNNIMLSNVTVGTSAAINTPVYAPILNLASGAAIQAGSFTSSGTNTGGKWNRFITVERIK